MENYRPNSNRFKSERDKNYGQRFIDTSPDKASKKVVTGRTKARKKTGIRKFVEAFIVEDMTMVRDYVVLDVLLPKIKETFLDVVDTALAMALCGEKGKKRSGIGASKVSYGGYYDRRNRSDENTRTSAKSVYDYADVIFDSRQDAQAVLARMAESITAYGIVTVADFYDYADMTCDFTADNYGWTDIRGAKIIPGTDGWEIRLPKAMPID
ncbi:MAG: hypothetical protein NC078_08425 [Ruminococcus sp.]|nr:hypothetical protein [Ruminococcus sp.]